MEASQEDLFYVEIPKVSMPIVPEESLLGKSRFRILEQYQNNTENVVVIDDSNTINKIIYGLKDARPTYSSLINHGMNQKLLEESKVSEETLRDMFAKIDKILWQKGCIWAELIDGMPEKRGYQLEEGHDVVLYRNVNISKKGVDLNSARTIPLSLPREAGRITEEWRGVLGATADTIHFPINTSYSNKYLDGMSFLVWDYRKHTSPALDSGKGANDWFSDRVTLLGNKTPPQELVAGFRATEKREKR